MDDKLWEVIGVFLFVVVLVVVFVLGVVAGVGSGKSMMREAAIEVDVAEWRCDPKTGDSEFHWLMGEKETEEAE